MKLSLFFSATVLASLLPVQAQEEIWDATSPLGKTAELPVLENVRFHVIKPYEFEKDGYRFLHGVGLGFYKGRLYASFGHNQGGENTETEEARICHSDDLGKTWSAVSTIDSGEEPGIGVSHGVFHVLDDQLWAFQGAYTGTMKQVHTRAYRLNEDSGEWEPRGTIIGDGFWPMQEPRKMANGNWIMGGLRGGKGNPPAVAISHGDDFESWDLVVIETPKTLKKVWGEATVYLDDKQATLISRWGDQAKALVSTSQDFGRTWTTLQPSNLPMATSKPFTGTLSNGQHYLVCTTTADSGGRRSPLTIAVTRPGETTFSKVFVIRHAEFPDGPGESHPDAKLSYPHAIEIEGHLYVGYSNSGGGVGRVGKGRELWNNNSAELAVIPLSALSQ